MGGCRTERQSRVMVITEFDAGDPEEFRRPAKNKIKGMSDMKKIKAKLVTFITDNVRLVDKNLVGRIG